MWDHNPYEPGTAEHFTFHMAAQAQQRRAAQQPIQWPKNFGQWVAGLGCCFFLFGVLWSISAVTVIGHVILIVGMTLLGMAIAVAGYAIILGPKFLMQVIRWAWGKNALTRSVLLGALIGIGLGAWLGLSIHGGNLLRGVLVVGLLGSALGLVVGGVLTLVRRAGSKAPVS